MVRRLMSQMSALLAVTTLVAGCARGAVASTPQSTTPPPKAQSIAASPQGPDMNHPFAKKVSAMPDDVYRRRTSPNGKLVDDERVGALAMEAVTLGFRGLLLGGPRRADLDDSSLWALLVQAGVPRHDAPLNRNATLVATELERGDVLAGRAMRPNPTKYDAEDAEDLPLPPPPPPPPPDLAALGEGVSAGFVWFDAVDILSLPRSQGRWVLRVLSFDELSNEVLVETSSRHPGVAAKATPAKSHPLIATTRGPHTPTLASAGAALVLEGRPAAKNLVLHGAIRVEPASYMSAGSVKATILLLAKNHSAPIQVPLVIPAPRLGDLIDAPFSINVGDVLPEQPMGPWCAYLVVGRHISAPLALTF